MWAPAREAPKETASLCRLENIIRQSTLCMVLLRKESCNERNRCMDILQRGHHMADFVPTSNTSGETHYPRTILDFALHYTDEGLRVLPLHSICSPDECTCGRANCSSVGKHPRTQKGVKEATCNKQQIKAPSLRTTQFIPESTAIPKQGPGCVDCL